MYANKRWFYRVFVITVYDDENVQNVSNEITFDFKNITEAQNFAIICMEHNKDCIINIQLETND